MIISAMRHSPFREQRLLILKWEERQTIFAIKIKWNKL